MYVDVFHDKDKEILHVVERVNGQRIFKTYPTDYHFYVDDPHGSDLSINDIPVKKLQPKSYSEYKNLKSIYSHTRTWESDIPQINRCLETHYATGEQPNLHIAFIDIETGFDAVRGYSPPSEAFNPIISISVCLKWLEQTVCVAIPPPTLSWDDALAIANRIPNVYLVSTEKELLDITLDLLSDADIISGWNSEYFDVPYIVNRINTVMGKYNSKRLCLWNQKPIKKEMVRGGKKEMVYDLIGRVHLDYLKLYKKFNTEERTSYSLDNISEFELGEKKVEYDGSLDQLYKRDFKLFIEYNIQDANLLKKLDAKLQYIELANGMSHYIRIKIPAVMGSVGMTEQAIIIEAHSMGRVVHDKKEGYDDEYYDDDEDEENIDNKAAGGWVSNPKIGLHDWVGAIDMNSLYPSVIRAFNMSNETIVGQIDTSRTVSEIKDWIKRGGQKHVFASWWNDRFSTLEMENYFTENKSNLLTLHLENGDDIQLTGAELKQLVFDKNYNWCISANGTIFRMDKKGVIPSLLERWYNERKIMKKCMNEYEYLEVNEKLEGIKMPSTLFTESDISYDSYEEASPFILQSAVKSSILKEMIKNNDRDGVVKYMNEHRLIVINGKVHYHDQKKLKSIIGFWDKRQHVRKILLNSVYGGLLNSHHRFFDQRLGQSTTLSGRCLTRHMSAKVNEILTGEYDYCGETVKYGDTDSLYFSAYNTLKPAIESGEITWSIENIVMLYDDICTEVNTTFADYLLDTFNVPKTYGNVIAASREIVAKKALFITKKRYAALVVDKEGKRQDIGGATGKVKVTGLDLRRNDTPKTVQKFLSEILKMVLDDKNKEQIIDRIVSFKNDFVKTDPWTWGKPTKANKYTHYFERREEELRIRESGGKTKGFTVPAQVLGSIFWNELLHIHDDRMTMKIVDGSNVIMCYLKETPKNPYSRICYPVDELRLPEWFKNLPFDTDKMIETIVDKKIHNLLWVLNWDLSRIKLENEPFYEMMVYDDDDC